MLKLEPLYEVGGRVWPILTSLSVFNVVIGAVSGFGYIMVGLMILVITIIGWLMDRWVESGRIGVNTNGVIKELGFGVLLIIISEVILFFAMFWFLVYLSFEGSVSLGYEWPGQVVGHLDVISVPLLIRAILVRSGVRLTWAHRRIMSDNLLGYYVGYLITIVLGIIFLLTQWGEYSLIVASLGNGVVTRIFYILTFFHGSHVIVGVIINVLSLVLSVGLRLPIRFWGVEVSMWYWHFVDVVWLFLLVLLYWFSILSYRLNKLSNLLLLDN